MSRTRLILEAVWPTVIMWLALITVALWKDATWPPNGDRWLSFLLICVLIEVLLVKPFIMLKHMRGLDWLTVSLAATNLSLAAIFLAQQVINLWPLFFAVEHYTATIWFVRTLEIITIGIVLVTLWQLVNVPDPEFCDE